MRSCNTKISTTLQFCGRRQLCEPKGRKVLGILQSVYILEAVRAPRLVYKSHLGLSGNISVAERKVRDSLVCHTTFQPPFPLGKNPC